ncbi:MAG: hypothetical protein ACI4PF_00345 [Christensenellales bacterium]
MGFFSKLFRKKTKDKYNIKPEENIAREVYGIPNPNKYDYDENLDNNTSDKKQ